MERKIIFCRCGSNEHQLIITPDIDISKSDNKLDFLYISPCLSDNLRFHQRVILAIKYIFGYRSNAGMFGDLVLDRDGVKDLVTYLDKFLHRDQYNVPN